EPGRAAKTSILLYFSLFFPILFYFMASGAGRMYRSRIRHWPPQPGTDSYSPIDRSQFLSQVQLPGSAGYRLTSRLSQSESILRPDARLRVVARVAWRPHSINWSQFLGARQS